jgi:hypothetical protein
LGEAGHPMAKMGVAETTPKCLRGGSVTPVWPGSEFGHPKPADLGVVKPPLKQKKIKKSSSFFRVGLATPDRSVAHDPRR